MQVKCYENKIIYKVDNNIPVEQSKTFDSKLKINFTYSGTVIPQSKVKHFIMYQLL